MARYFGVPLRNGLPIGLGASLALGKQAGGIPPSPSADALLQEDGTSFFYLQNNSGYLLLEGLMPTLWLDFQNSTSLDSRITFTRASTATYFNSSGVLTTAASGAARFDYNPSTLQPLGLLIEEQRTNSFPNSNDFSNATYWTVYGTAVATGSAAVGPDGLTSASNLAGATDTTLSGNNLEESVSISASTAYTFSVFVKSNGGTEVVLRLRDSTGGSTSSVTLAVTSAWQRVSLTRTMAVGATSVRCIIGQTNGNILIYGAQLEAGAFATSYIPTTTTALTRNADVASMTGTNFSSWYNASEGTIFADFQVPFDSSASIFPVAAMMTDGTFNNSISSCIRTVDDSSRFFVRILGVTEADITAGTSYVYGSFRKQAAAYALNNCAMSVNGSSVGTDSTVAIPTVDRMILGNGIGGSLNTLNGTIRRIAYYPTRLPNSTLQALTA
jgi:hypothetical protein